MANALRYHESTAEMKGSEWVLPFYPSMATKLFTTICTVLLGWITYDPNEYSIRPEMALSQLCDLFSYTPSFHLPLCLLLISYDK